MDLDDILEVLGRHARQITVVLVVIVLLVVLFVDPGNFLRRAQGWNHTLIQIDDFIVRLLGLALLAIGAIGFFLEVLRAFAKDRRRHFDPYGHRGPGGPGGQFGPYGPDDRNYLRFEYWRLVVLGACMAFSGAALIEAQYLHEPDQPQKSSAPGSAHPVASIQPRKREKPPVPDTAATLEDEDGSNVQVKNPAPSECVWPASKVKGSVRVRGTPSVAGPILDELRPGKPMPLVAELPGWTEAQRPDGTTGFVSSELSEIAPCATKTQEAPSFQLHAIDVGTGLAVFVRGADFTWLYDGGSNDDRGLGTRNRVLAYLQTLSPKVTLLNDVVLSHPHRDHVVLLPDVLQAFPVDDIWDSGRPYDSAAYESFREVIAAHPTIRYHTELQNFGSEPTGTKSGTQLHFNSRMTAGPVSVGRSATMTLLHVDGATHPDPNDNSVVVRMDLGRYRVLLMGDAGGGDRRTPDSPVASGSVEGQLLACCADALHADVLIVGHHGSETSSRRAFLDAVGAHVFVISSGPTKYNKRTLPDTSVVNELESRGQVLRTDLNDETCGSRAGKVGPGNDGKPGGCDNILIQFPPDGALVASYRPQAN